MEEEEEEEDCTIADTHQSRRALIEPGVSP
jgi:hypothetical protein